jgi:hypothetical protein
MWNPVTAQLNGYLLGFRLVLRGDFPALCQFSPGGFAARFFGSGSHASALVRVLLEFISQVHIRSRLPPRQVLNLG